MEEISDANKEILFMHDVLVMLIFTCGIKLG